MSVGQAGHCPTCGQRLPGVEANTTIHIDLGKQSAEQWAAQEKRRKEQADKQRTIKGWKP